MLRLIFLCFY